MIPRDPRDPDYEPADAADDFAREVEKIVTPLLVHTHGDEGTQDDPPVPRQWRISWIAGTVAIVLTLIGTVAWKYEHRKDDARQSTTEVQPRRLISPAPPPPEVIYEPRPSAPADTTAICNDTTASFSKHSIGTCAGHDGVLCWIHHPVRNPPTTAPFCTTSAQKPRANR